MSQLQLPLLITNGKIMKATNVADLVLPEESFLCYVRYIGKKTTKIAVENELVDQEYIIRTPKSFRDIEVGWHLVARVRYGKDNKVRLDHIESLEAPEAS
jgi:hypothetical protein